MSALVFLDTETTGLDPIADDIWEIAVIRREPDGKETTYQAFVEHDLAKAAQLPDSFRADHDARYDPAEAITRKELLDGVQWLCRDRAHLIGAVPSFDAERLGHLRRALGIHERDPWHYHLQDVENLAIGYLQGRAAMGDYIAGIDLNDSEALSHAVGVDPADYPRHTAMGDVRWAMAIYDKVMGGQ